MFNYAIKWEAIQRNPMAYVDAIASKARKVKWTKEHVRTFLETGYADYQYRNITLIVHMAYEWCQRIGDIRLLKWDAIDFDKQMVTITQSKRGATVYLPITEGLFRMLQQQKEDYGFQEYVVSLAVLIRPAIICLTNLNSCFKHIMTGRISTARLTTLNLHNNVT